MFHLSDIYTEISEVTQLLHQKGWAEKNAGNFSIMIEDEIVFKDYYKSHQLVEFYPKLAGNIFLVSGKGMRMRDITKSPSDKTILIKISENGDSYITINDKQVFPTSELQTHLAIHNMIAERASNEKAVIHTHVNELIALTHIKEFCEQDSLNNLLWQMHPETIMFVPNGVAFVPFELPGSAKIAAKTVDALKNHQIAIWEKHGVFSIAPNLNDCYDLIDIVAKSAEIYFKCSSSGNLPQGLSDDKLEQLKKIEF